MKFVYFFVLVISIAFYFAYTNEKKFKWAFAQSMDNSFHPNENCRESLADSLYVKSNIDKTTRIAKTNSFVFRGNIESYRIYGFNTQQECEAALTGMVLRAK